MLELIWPEINTVGHARNSVFNVRYNESSDIEGRRISNKSTEKSHELEARKDSAELKIRESEVVKEINEGWSKLSTAAA